MPKIVRTPVLMYSGRFESQTPTPAEHAVTFLADHPARAQILRYLVHANELGFDPSGPDIMRRAVAAGGVAHEAECRRRARESSYQMFAMVNRDRHPPLVYYLRLAELVKIGTSTSLGKRVSCLNPQGVMAVEPGGPEVEEQRHEQFSATRHHGEWFRWDENLGIHIVALRERFQAETGNTLESWLYAHTPRRRGQPRRSVYTGPKKFTGTIVALPGGRLPGDLTGLVPAAEAARAVGMTRQAFNCWRVKGRVTPVAMFEGGRKLYRLSEVLAASDR